MNEDGGTATAPLPIPLPLTDQKPQLKSLQKENKNLRAEVRKLDQQFKQIETELLKSNAVKDRLENLCRELQKQNKFIKAESTSKLQEAHDKGKELAVEVQNNMGFMKSINDNLASITTENMKVRHENEELNSKIEIIQSHYDKREEIIQDALNETSEACLAAQTELAELKLQNAEEKEKLYIEMQQLATSLVSSREQLKESKGTELQLRQLLQTYESKFNGLQTALKETNSAYESFRGEMGKVTKKTKELEADAQKWRKRWEESKESFAKVEKNKDNLESELKRANEGLGKMTELCRALQDERKQMLQELKHSEDGKENKKPLTNNDTSLPTIHPDVDESGKSDEIESPLSSPAIEVSK